MDESLGDVKGSLPFLPAPAFLHMVVHFGGKAGRSLLGHGIFELGRDGGMRGEMMCDDTRRDEEELGLLALLHSQAKGTGGSEVVSREFSPGRVSTALGRPWGRAVLKGLMSLFFFF